MPKAGTKSLEWISAQGSKLGALAGHWIAVPEGRGVLSSHATLSGALRKARLSEPGASPYVFRVPATKELEPLDLSTLWAKTLRKKKG
jgi:hypothetical protein